MTETPASLISHTVAASHWSDADELAAAVRDRLPDVDLRVARTPAQTDRWIGGAEVLLTSRLDPATLDGADDLRWVQAMSAGVEFYPLDRLRSAGVVLTNASGVHAEPIAEQVLGTMLAFERRLHRACRQQADRTWDWFRGGEILGGTLAIVGVGAIGSRVAELGQAFEMTVLGVKRDLSTIPSPVDEAVPPTDLHDVLARGDYVVVACPLTEETRGMIAETELAVMPSSAVLINVARGPIVDEDDLVYALKQRRIRGAGLDVFDTEPLPEDSPLWGLPNAIITPHMAGSSPQKAGRAADLFAANYRAFREGDLDALRNRVL